MVKPVLIALLFAAAFWLNGSFRVTSAQFDWQVIAQQFVISLLILALPCALLAAGRLRNKITLWLGITICSMAAAQAHASLNEASLRHQHGQHPITTVVEARWFPFSSTPIQYEPQMGRWLGDD